MKIKILAFFLFAVLVFLSLFYFELPFNLVRPVFHADAINRYANEYGLDPLLLTAVIKVESNFIRRARSHRGAVGLMQVLPSTARELASELGYKDFSGVDLENPDTNIHFGSFYIKILRDEFGGNMILAMAAYNAGRNKVRSWYDQNPLIGVEYSDIPYRETRNYVENVMNTYRWLLRIQKLKILISPGKGRQAWDAGPDTSGQAIKQ